MKKRKGHPTKIVSSPLVAVFRRAAKRHTAERRTAAERHTANLPTDGDWNRFLEAARDSLANAPGLKQRLRRRGHAILMRGAVSTATVRALLRTELWRAAEYAVSKGNLDDLERGKGPVAAIAASRVAAAGIAADVFRCTVIERPTLVDATLLLRELQHDIDALSRQERVGRYTKTPGLEDKATIEWVRREYREWRARHQDRPASEGVVFLHNKATKAGLGTWPTPGAFRSWMHRKHILQ